MILPGGILMVPEGGFFIVRCYSLLPFKPGSVRADGGRFHRIHGCALPWRHHGYSDRFPGAAGTPGVFQRLIGHLYGLYCRFGDRLLNRPLSRPAFICPAQLPAAYCPGTVCPGSVPAGQLCSGIYCLWPLSARSKQPDPVYSRSEPHKPNVFFVL